MFKCAFFVYLCHNILLDSICITETPRAIHRRLPYNWKKCCACGNAPSITAHSRTRNYFTDEGSTPTRTFTTEEDGLLVECTPQSPYQTKLFFFYGNCLTQTLGYFFKKNVPIVIMSQFFIGKHQHYVNF